MTNITAEHRAAFEALTSGRFGNFALFSCFLDGEPAVSIVAVNPEDLDHPLIRRANLANLRPGVRGKLLSSGPRIFRRLGEKLWPGSCPYIGQLHPSALAASGARAAVVASNAAITWDTASPVGECRSVVAGNRAASEIRLVDKEKIGIGLFTEKTIQVMRGGYVLQVLRVEVEHRLIQISQVMSADARLPVLDLLAHGAIVGEETMGLIRGVRTERWNYRLIVVDLGGQRRGQGPRSALHDPH